MAFPVGFLPAASRWRLLQRFEESANSLPATTGAGHTALQPRQETRNHTLDICNYFKEVVMSSEEAMREEEEDEEEPFFKAAFDHFDWNHSSTIPTSVRVNPFTHF